ncbi:MULTISPECIES: calmodulin [Pseudoalteromonas]|uniref:EF-hand domain-containing protein n=1 Tax=Pseudoalteromonas piscicida TaxID=43662 RepID=A0AAD0RL01_PSEO7|nr:MULTISPECIES: calmodulin [Pseudoalteromonas]ASD69750.1 calmodulin [Pseudoalteromonas piscicida]AUJ72650.1 EF hand [Pseudoalteromonas sp. NC201]AXR04755.1 EF-hand domain-containing protein [Pseudoalteromonas piscicida]MBR8844174.1 EF-hand domain-containing protein [Pseudoalteromonas sp. JC3]MCG7556284.1 EF-hand domain-containing protein [Pseudoalteromonas sp. Of11M-6]
MKNLLAALSITGMTLVSASAMAMDDFEKYDTDGSGTISMSEAQVNPKLAEQFKTLDVDGNGELSESEYEHFEG